MNHINDFELNKMLNQEVEASRLTEIKMHIDECIICRQNLEKLQNLDLKLHQVSEQHELPFLNEKIMAKINPSVKLINDGKGVFITLISVIFLTLIASTTFIIRYSTKNLSVTDDYSLINKNIISHLNYWVYLLKQITTKSNIEILSTFLLLIILVSVYFIYDNFKKGKGIYTN